MDPIPLLASSLGRNDEEPNIALAHAIAEQGDAAAIATLIDALGGKVKAARSDAIKVLYEIGARRPDLIAPHVGTFVTLLASRENRLVWGAMTALDTIVDLVPETIAVALPALDRAAMAGSVITNDRYTSILATLNAQCEYREAVFPLLLTQLRRAPVNQLPMYAEFAASSVSPDQVDSLAALLSDRLEELSQEAKRRRIATVLRGLAAKSAHP